MECTLLVWGEQCNSLLVCLQIGWAAAPLILFLFAAVTWYTTMMLADCYRYPDPNTGQRNYTYVDAVRTILGEWDFYGFCCLPSRRCCTLLVRPLSSGVVTCLAVLCCAAATEVVCRGSVQRQC